MRLPPGLPLALPPALPDLPFLPPLPLPASLRLLLLVGSRLLSRLLVAPLATPTPALTSTLGASPLLLPLLPIVHTIRVRIAGLGKATLYSVATNLTVPISKSIVRFACHRALVEELGRSPPSVLATLGLVLLQVELM